MRPIRTLALIVVISPALQAFTFSLPSGFDLPLDVAPILDRIAQADPIPDEATTGATVDGVVDRMQSYYDGLEDFVADFEQVYTSAALGESSTSTGRVHVKLPGMMRWDYATPTQRFFISDGQNLWIYEPDPGQYYTQSLADSDLPTALSFLMGNGDLRTAFAIELLDAGDETATLELTPLESEGQYERLRFVVSLEDGAVMETTIFDPVGNTNHFTFSDRSENVGYEASDFAFSPPDGAVEIQSPNP